MKVVVVGMGEGGREGVILQEGGGRGEGGRERGGGHTA